MTQLEVFQRKALQVSSEDNVAVALVDLRAGDTVSLGGREWTIRSQVGAKQKFALRDLGLGDSLVMYGVIVGEASEAIPQGVSLSTANVRHQRAPLRKRASRYDWEPVDVSR